MGLERSMLVGEVEKRNAQAPWLCLQRFPPLQSIISETARPYGGMQLHEGVHISMVVGCCKHRQGQYRLMGVATEMAIRGKPHYTVDDHSRRPSTQDKWMRRSNTVDDAQESRAENHREEHV